MASRNPRAQPIFRLLFWWKTSLHLRISASHAPGAVNTRADAGSRISANEYYATLFSSLTPEWTLATPSVDIPDLTTLWERISGLTPLQIPRLTNIAALYGLPGSAEFLSIIKYNIFRILYFTVSSLGLGPADPSAAIQNWVFSKAFDTSSPLLEEFPIQHPHICMLLKGISRLDTPRVRKSPVSIFWRLVFTASASTLPLIKHYGGRSEIVAISSGCLSGLQFGPKIFPSWTT
ncbi:LOW QUALITY PROTEIN: hypothetical protein PHMEG_00021015 [Phytophthora megakarya]|uniref:Uncharacterized protein n=1 Tax=Phytophthora megakarya TaxID=4795 RepID=A0A225VMF9_9STRA|nr:LOW QUALITY PROTEIN: hypothetical protein PHMEG_00021015 [Phytophthora megakarya]